MTVKILEVAGLVPSLQALRLPFGSKRSKTHDESGELHQYIDEETGLEVFQQHKVSCVDVTDVDLAQKLIIRGDEHAKALRGIMVWLDITAPIYWWREMETYRAGRERLSCESTMHIDCRGLKGDDLQRAKAAIPMGHEQRAIDVYSYQTLRRIWLQRRNHRLQEWQDFLDQLRDDLPYSELCFVEPQK